MLENILLGIVSICTFISYFPQIVKCLKTKEAEDLSIWSWILWVVSSLAYTSYAIICTDSFMLVFETTMELTFCAIILICAIIYRKKDPKIIISSDDTNENKKSKGIVVAGFGAIGKTYLGKHYPNIIDMESGFYKHINEGFENIDVEKRKGTTIRPDNPNWPSNYYQAILETMKQYDVVLTSMHWDLLKFYEDNNIPYYIAFPEQGLEDEYAKRCYDRGNNEKFTEHMIKNIKLWSDKLKDYKPIKILYLKSGEFLEDVLKRENII